MAFQKGFSGNPAGRPKQEESLTGILRDMMDNYTAGETGEQITIKQALAEKLISSALKTENISFIKYIYDRLDGFPRQTTEMLSEQEIHIIIPESIRPIIDNIESERMRESIKDVITKDDIDNYNKNFEKLDQE